MPSRWGIDPAAGGAETPGPTAIRRTALAVLPPHVPRTSRHPRSHWSHPDAGRPSPNPRRARGDARGSLRPRRRAGGADPRLRDVELPLAPGGTGARPTRAHRLRARPLRPRRVRPSLGRRLRARGPGGVPGSRPHRAARRPSDGGGGGDRRSGGAPAGGDTAGAGGRAGARQHPHARPGAGARGPRAAGAHRPLPPPDLALGAGRRSAAHPPPARQRIGRRPADAGPAGGALPGALRGARRAPAAPHPRALHPGGRHDRAGAGRRDGSHAHRLGRPGSLPGARRGRPAASGDRGRAPRALS